MTEKIIIRTSDRLAFKRCRQAWDFGSKIRLNLEPLVEDQNLRFGTAMHAALEQWYDPKLWHGDRKVAASLAALSFVNNYPCPYPEPSPEQEADHKAERDLGLAMLEHYIEWSPEVDKDIEPLYTEIEFEIQIPVNIGMAGRFLVNSFGNMCYGDKVVVYQGKIDLIYRDKLGNQWIRDFKTTSRIDDGVEEWLAYDEQCASYCWAIQRELGIEIAGFEWVQLLKSEPHKPNVLKNGSLSVDKRQNTTYDLYLTTIRDMGYNPTDYAEILGFLRAQGNKFFRRTQVRKSQRELELHGERIVVEVVDMLNDPAIYPNPNMFQCRRCQFKAPCLAKIEGSDYEWLLSDLFRMRD